MIGGLGAEISGVDLSKPPQAELIAEIRTAFLEYGVICIRDQDLSPADQLAFAREFGEIDTYPFLKPIEGHPGVIPIIKEPETKLNFGGGWHTDGSYMDLPPMATVLYAVEVPEHGGDTLYASATAAYDSLSPGMKELLEGMQAVFTAAAVHGDQGAYALVRAGDGEKQADANQAEKRCLHPVVRTHPETGRKALYVGRFHVERIEGMTKAESDPLLSYLIDHTVSHRFTTRLRWTAGTLAMWDNRCVQHYALNDYPGQRREMRRITLKGDTPI